MKTCLFSLFVLLTSVWAMAQGNLISPQLSLEFKDKIVMHNMHIVSDGSYYYTINGGTASKGAVNKYTMNGRLVAEYNMYLDMRSIMYNPQDGGLYVSTNDKKICKLTNLSSGSYETKFDQLFDNGQACLALSADGNYLYYLSNGVLKKFDFNNGQLLNSYNGLQSGTNSSFVVAADEEYLYTFDSDNKKVYVYDLSANYIGSLSIPNGSYRFSLSVTNGMLFTSYDGNSATGTWYGYKVKSSNYNKQINSNSGGSSSPELSLQFDDQLARHNIHLSTDGSSLYTVNGGGTNGEINRYNLKGEFLNKYTISLDMRSIFFNPQDGSLYVCALDKGIYKITNLESGSYEKKFSDLYEESQAVLAASADGNYLYYFCRGTLKKYDFNNGSLIKTYYGLNYGENSPMTVAVDYEFIYTFDSDNKTVYVYDLEAKLVKTLVLPQGNFSFSLSTAIDLLFVAKDGNYATGTWYGYKVH